MKRVVLLLALAALTAEARLDYIDADGVTETGGTSDKARMLPRTKADGTLDASLLPPLGALASIPDPKRLYVSATAPANGNGSALAPFRTLQEAVTNVAAGGAILVAPGAYSAFWALPAASAVTLVGSGPKTELTLTAASSSSELILVNTAVPSLTVNGGQAGIRLVGSRVAMVGGNASPVTVYRTDLGSRADVLPAGATDAYTGHDTVPYATAVRGDTATLTLAGTRPVVGDEATAFISDLQAATNAVQTVIARLHEVDAALSDAITAEAALRASGDAAQGLALTNATDALRVQIAEIGSNWQTQLNTILTSLSNVSTLLAALSVKETNDVASLQAEDTRIRASFAAADTALHTTITGEILSEVGDLEERVSGDVAALQSEDAAIRTAFAGADSALHTTISGEISTTASGLQSQINTLSTAIGTIQTRLGQIRSFIHTKHGEYPY